MLNEAQNILKKVLDDSGIECKMEDVWISPSITTYTLKPAEDIDFSRIASLSNDLALAIKAYPIRVVAPIPGTSLVGIEIPNENRKIISIEEELNKKEFKEQTGSLVVPLGRDTHNNSQYVDLRKQISIMIGGATGSGKSNFFHSIFASLTSQYTPKELRFILADAKRVEFPPTYSNSPYVLPNIAVIYESVLGAFKWCLAEIDRRFELMSGAKVQKLEKYNETAKEKLPYIVILVDEFSDFAVADKNGELISTMVKVMQTARLAGVVVIISSSRPCSETFPPLLVENCPSRFAFSTASATDSQFILGEGGAEKLLGRGDVLFLGIEGDEESSWKTPYPIRLQTPYINMDKMDYHSYVYHFKCRPCQLEFSVYSWNDNWSEKNSPFCPECGKQDTFFQIKKISEKSICALVYDENI